MNVDILICHPHKHHVYHLTVGCQMSGYSTLLLVPLYRKGLGALVAAMPTSFGRRARGYYEADLRVDQVVSPLKWQVRRLLTRGSGVKGFEDQFDRYVANRLSTGSITTKMLVTMQDYMPETVRAANSLGIRIWSDQILNRSAAAQLRINEHISKVGGASSNVHLDTLNKSLVKNASIVTAPSAYVLDGLKPEDFPTVKFELAPYGVDARKFSVEKKCSAHSVRVLARANNARKGGHLLVEALESCAQELLASVDGLQIEFIIIGTLDSVVEKALKAYRPPPGLLIHPMVVPHVDMPALLAASDLFVMPSLSEGMSLICIEAMQAGLPIIVTSYCGIDCFRDMEMGVSTTDSAVGISTSLKKAFRMRANWDAWGAAAKLAAQSFSWKRYRERVCQLAVQAMK